MLNNETVKLLKEYPILRAAEENLAQQYAYKKDRGADPAELEHLKHRQQEILFVLEQLDRGLSALTEEERLILDKMYIHPVKGMTMALCDALEVELATVYRRRNKALAKLSRAMPAAMDN